MIRLLSIGFGLAIRHRTLWCYGALIALLDGQCVRLGLGVQFSGQQRDALLDSLENLQGDSVVTVLSIIVAGVFGYWLLATLAGNWALGALIAGVESAHHGDEPAIRTVAHVGIKRFWSMSILGLFTALPVVLLIGIDAALGLTALFTRQALLEVLLVAWLPVALLGGLLFSIIGEVAQVDVVVRDSGPVQALRYGFRLLWSNPWRLLGAWLFVNALVGSFWVLITAGPVGFVLIPWFVASSGGFFESFVMLLLLAVMLLFAGIGVALHRALWVLAYRELSDAMPVTRRNNNPKQQIRLFVR